MARKSMNELLAELLTSFPDQNVKAITPAILRGYFTDFINAIRPAYALLQRTAGVIQALTVAPAPLVFTSQDVSSGNGEFGNDPSNPANGRIQRLDAGTVRFNFTADLVLASNQARTITFTLYKDGVATSWRQSITTTTSGVIESVTLTAIAYAAAAANYQMYVQISVNDNATFSNMTLVAEVVPVNSY